jgi:hypothetical protein
MSSEKIEELLYSSHQPRAEEAISDTSTVIPNEMFAEPK